MATENKDVQRVFTTAALMSATLIPGQFAQTTDTNQIVTKKLSDSSLRYWSDDSAQVLLATAQTVTGSKTFSATSVFNAGVSVNSTLGITGLISGVNQTLSGTLSVTGDVALTGLFDLSSTGSVNLDIHVDTDNNGSNDAVYRIFNNGSATATWAQGMDDSDSDSYKWATGSNNLGSGVLVTLTTAGKLGIGTTSPVSNIEISSLHPTLTLTSTDTAHSDGEFLSGIDFYTNDTSRQGVSGKIHAESLGTAGTTEIVISGYRSDDLREFARFSNAGITFNNANVGINTIAPSVELTVVGTEGSLPAIDAATVGLFQNNSTAGQDCHVTLIGGTTGQTRLYMGDSGNEDNLIIEHDNTGDGASRFEGEGSVLIKSNASYSLTLDGSTDVTIKQGGTLVADFSSSIVNIYKPTDITGNLDVTGAMVATGAVQGASLSTNGSETFDYNSGTFTMTMTGMSGTVSDTAEWYRYGDFVHLHIPLLTGTANATGCTLTGSYPNEIKPASGSNAILPYIALNGPRFGCQASIASGGTITIYYMDISVVQYSSTLPSSDSRQIPRCMISYSLH